MELDVLSIAAHRDDTELTCGGTVIKMAEAGYKVGALDLTAGESGTRGNAVLREKEAARAAKVMGLVYRENLYFPDAGLERRAARGGHHGHGRRADRRGPDPARDRGRARRPLTGTGVPVWPWATRR